MRKNGFTRTNFSTQNLRGFTIIELLIYMGLLSGFLVVLTQIFVAALDVQLVSEATSRTREDGRYILSRLEYDAGRATAITMPAAPGQSADSLQLIIGGEAFTYAITAANVTITNTSGTQSLNGTGTTVSGFSVQRLGNTNGKQSARVNFTLISTGQGVKGSEVRSYQTTIGVR
ncbi:MAG: hypothetical protein UY27_C0009G0012 [Candidatus Gottesmanbacteria bacterium GW2011_GWA1_48_13]|uniref:Prepilin-type N-terminal cleavage/methylation domain-containing protein n=1 Tax=Candidatus Gottesmanbacteria bacterium GW2011_GWA1_48_13 TaxID=1618439 RepID=A0A0G1UNN1_9BACT|nr:MAG: hypothetical protein UY27_C0009G0012 [Candidatus Gottesmanbacteria bacterium GW2011_GWA1_48_13]